MNGELSADDGFVLGATHPRMVNMQHKIFTSIAIAIILAGCANNRVDPYDGVVYADGKLPSSPLICRNQLGFYFPSASGSCQADGKEPILFGPVEDIISQAQRGDSAGQRKLGELYLSRTRFTEAASWYRKAADQGDAEAQYRLGLLYSNGQGVPKDDQQAANWVSKSAAQGYSNARSMLATMAKFWPTPSGLTSSAVAMASPPAISPAGPSMAQSSLQRVQKATPAVVQNPPVFTVLPVLQTTTESVEISGKVGGGNLAALTVDGKAAPFKTDGSFNFRRAVSIGDSDVKLVATNEWGQSAEATIKVTRTIPTGSEIAFSPLEPSRHRGQVRPNAIALIIGIERYKSAPPAEFAEDDARSFYDYAVNALGVPAPRVKLLTGADAQRVDVEAAILTWLKPQVVKGQTEVFVFFSGHGLASDDGKDLYLLPQDGNRALLDRSALRRKELIYMIVDSGAKSATLFLDTCYSGGTRGKDNLIASARPILVAAKEQTVPPNVTILAAAGNDQLSSSLAQAKHGLFSYFLMKGLEGDAAGPDRTITAAKLEAYLAEKIPVEAAKLGRTQTPQLIGDGNRVVSSW